MNEIIKFTEKTTDNGNRGILASELYKNLSPKGRDFVRWVDRNIVRNQYLVKNKDYIEILEPTDSGIIGDGGTRNPGRPRVREKNYILSCDAAKKISLSTKTPRQQEVVDAITKFMNVATKEPMIPASQVANMVERLVMETLSRQNARVGNYDALLLENKQKDEAIKSLQLTGKIKKNAIDCQATIRQIVNIVARETPYYAEKKDAHQILYNMVMCDYFRRHPVKWRADWYALKSKEYAKTEFERIKNETGEKPMSKLDWIRLAHGDAMISILDCARNMAVNNLPYTYFTNGGTLPA